MKLRPGLKKLTLGGQLYMPHVEYDKIPKGAERYFGEATPKAAPMIEYVDREVEVEVEVAIIASFGKMTKEQLGKMKKDHLEILAIQNDVDFGSRTTNPELVELVLTAQEASKGDDE